MKKEPVTNYKEESAWEQEFDERYSPVLDPELYAVFSIMKNDLKSFVRSEKKKSYESGLRFAMGKLAKEVAIHEQLVKEWTGIRTDGGRTESFNPHLEKLEALTLLADDLQAELEGGEHVQGITK